jgi:hypothetical protein
VLKLVKKTAITEGGGKESEEDELNSVCLNLVINGKETNDDDRGILGNSFIGRSTELDLGKKEEQEEEEEEDDDDEEALCDGEDAYAPRDGEILVAREGEKDDVSENQLKRASTDNGDEVRWGSCDGTGWTSFPTC